MIKANANAGKFIGRALMVGKHVSACDASALRELGLEVELMGDPYAAMAELASRPLAYRALVLSLAAIFPEELAIVNVVKKRYPHVKIMAGDTAGRPALLAEVKKLGVEQIVVQSEMPATASLSKDKIETPAEINENDEQLRQPAGEPVLTAEELRALLEDQPLSGNRGRAPGNRHG